MASQLKGSLQSLCNPVYNLSLPYKEKAMGHVSDYELYQRSGFNNLLHGNICSFVKFLRWCCNVSWSISPVCSLRNDLDHNRTFVGVFIAVSISCTISLVRLLKTNSRHIFSSYWLHGSATLPVLQSTIPYWLSKG